MPLADLSFAPHSHGEGRRSLSLTLPGKTPLGLFLTFLSAWKDLHQCCTSSSHTMNSLLSLITRLHTALGRLCDMCSACVTPVVSSGFPQDYQRLEEADSTAAKGQLEQHPMQSMTQKSGRLQASGVPWFSARDGGQPWLKHCVSPYQEGKTSGPSYHRNYIAVKLRVLVSKDQLCNSLSSIQQETVKGFCVKYRSKSQIHPVAHEQVLENAVTHSNTVHTMSSGQLPSCCLQLLRSQMLVYTCSLLATLPH